MHSSDNNKNTLNTVYIISCMCQRGRNEVERQGKAKVNYTHFILSALQVAIILMYLPLDLNVEHFEFRLTPANQCQTGGCHRDGGDTGLVVVAIAPRGPR